MSAQPTSFVGRVRELAEIAALLRDPGCRLLSVIGPGGIGKTRLVAEVARRLAEPGAEVVFAPLQALASAAELPAAIASAAGIALTGPGEPRVQLLSQIRGRRLILVLDSFEHLLDGAGLLGDLLAAADGLRLVVTTRESLNLQDEWLFPLDGLDIPGAGQRGDIAGYAAVQLFVERARRARGEFALDAERDAVLRICRLVEGMPLAI